MKKWALALITMIPASFIVFVLTEDFFVGTTINVLLLVALHKFFETWIKTLKKTETCANK